jgi:ABC-type multidrug transport system permease subunit
VPAEYLPAGVLTFAHVLPSYYFIDANNKIIYLENFDFASIWPVILNMMIVAIFSVAFAVIANIVSKKKQKIA